MFKLSALSLAIFCSAWASAHEPSYVCRPYQSGVDITLGSQATVVGKLRKNKMLDESDMFREISFVLMVARPFPALAFENSNEACEYSEFTLHLNSQQLAQAQAWMEADMVVRVSGTVQMAESSVEEYDNGVLTKIAEFSTFH